MDETDWGTQAQHWLDRLAQCSEPGPGVTRLPFTPEHKAATDILTELMHAAGLAVSMDAAGTLIGRRDGPRAAPVLLMGSHQDSVREGGAYDGIMGVVLPVLALMKLQQDGITLPYSIEILAFADEEGVRFPTALMGPRVLAGTFDMAALDLCDRDGISLRRAMEGFGLRPDTLPALKRDPAGILGWIEPHLEQGPVLEHAGQPVGVVSAICGIERHRIAFTGTAAHAGTVPMALRRDALAGASELIGRVERLAQDTDALLANIGTLQVRPGAVNSVPGHVEMTLELRSAINKQRAQAGADLADAAQNIATRRGLKLDTTRTYAQPATLCDGAIINHLSQAAAGLGFDAPTLPSGATHDTSAMADLCPVGMLFTRCKSGISHNPEEHVDAVAMSAAIEVLCRMMQTLPAK
ncbi:N-carbamoyl-L-amino acid hydrolase [Roseibaca ekhonensis]|uniref:N-carbamoyl-L-amino acid hydrolase n=1 Tax=Roseinatronobacter ekhonensis TaxID=254356 RepID=A0A3B0MEM0_9RHOB|nr:M20 family metallo-hydrolase [Roseibaca ekhonensis]SUZ32048.1 N-carbamoyl-L-amino acid hydrolase [Roseibaca ekhonensis]